MTLSRSPRFLTMFAASICLMAAGLVGAQASVAKTTSCKVPAYPGGDGNGYFTGRIKATSVTCVSARKLVRSYYSCRIRAGGKKGTCTRKVVNGLTCTEVRPASGTIPTQFNAQVTCRKGVKKVVHSYQQNTGE